MAMTDVSFLYLTDILDVQPVWRAFSQLSLAPMIKLHALGPILNKILL